MPCLQVGISAHTHQLQLSRNVVLVKFPQRHLLHAHPAQLSTATPICLATRTDSAYLRLSFFKAAVGVRRDSPWHIQTQRYSA